MIVTPPLRRFWPWIAGLAGAAIVVTVLVVRGGSNQTIADAPVTSTKAPDSIVVLDTAKVRLAGVELVRISSGAQNELAVNGTMTFDADRVSVVAPRAEGRLVSVAADLGQNVAAGKVLATVESPEIGQIRGDLERARVAVDVAKRNYEREKRLYEQNISPQKEMLDAEVLYRTAEADVRSAGAKLATYGATAGQGGRYGLATPIAGTVVERNASPGQIVGPTTNVFTVADLTHVWITVDVYEVDFKRIRPGAKATIIPVALPGETFEGHVRSTGGIVDTASHTFKVRVVVENESQRLRPGMFAQVRIQAPGTGSTIDAVSLPEVAVQDVNGMPVVFVGTGNPGRFIVRPVVVGPRTGTGSLIVTKGLRPGEEVVVKGAFQIKAELMKASFGESN